MWEGDSTGGFGPFGLESLQVGYRCKAPIGDLMVVCNLYGSDVF